MVVESVCAGPPVLNWKAGQSTAMATTTSPASVTARRFMALRLGRHRLEHTQTRTVV